MVGFIPAIAVVLLVQWPVLCISQATCPVNDIIGCRCSVQLGVISITCDGLTNGDDLLRLLPFTGEIAYFVIKAPSKVHILRDYTFVGFRIRRLWIQQTGLTQLEPYALEGLENELEELLLDLNELQSLPGKSFIVQ